MSNVELQAIARMYESLEKDAVTEKLAEKFAASGVTGFVMLGSARDISSACNCWRCQQERAKNAN